MKTVEQLLVEFNEYLNSQEIESLARQCGFIKRFRKLSGGAFVRVLTFGSLADPDLSYTDIQQYAAFWERPITAQGWEQRFTGEAADFLHEVLMHVVSQVATWGTPKAVPLLQRFQGVYIRDSSTITLPEELHSMWPGCGGSKGKSAALKVQLRWNYHTGTLEGPALQAGRDHDRQTPFKPAEEPAGNLSLADLGYFKLDEIAERQARGQHLITRYKGGTALYTSEGTPLELMAWLRHQQGQWAECQVLVGKRHRLPMRLLAFRLTEEKASRRRQHLKEYARKKQISLSKQMRFLAGWVVVLTTVPPEQLSAEEVAVLLRLRWQIEILFRVWKHHLRLANWRSRKPWRVLCELYGKLIAVTLMHWLFLLGWGQVLPFSMHKAAQAIQKMTPVLVWALLSSLEDSLTDLLDRLQRCFQVACTQNRRKGAPAAFQLLLQPELALT